MEADYMLFLDSDIACSNDFTVNVIDQLIKLQKDVVVGLYVDKRPPYRLHIYNFTADGLLMNIPEWDKEKPFKIDAGPTGFMFISKKVMDAFTPEVIERVGKPFSYLNYGLPSELGEDVSFCKRISKLGFEVWADPTINLVHYGKDGFTPEHYEYMKNVAAQNFENGIQGWMTPLELEFLSVMGNKPHVKTIVEVGSWKGRSTKALLDTGKKVVAVDTWEGSDDPRDLTNEMARKEDVFAAFMKNVGHYENLKTLRKDSKKAAAQFNDKSVDMVFIDANHTYEAVLEDIKTWLPKAKRILCGHDYADGWPGVKQAVKEMFGDKFRVVGSIWYVELT
jgi:predicted O-methyltransferase YrrM